MSQTMIIVIDGVSGVWTADQDDTLPEGYLSPHFREAEFDCNHCGKFGSHISRELLDVLEAVRAHFDAPVTINSGVRCGSHNAAVGGASNSRHKVEYADAADIVVSGIVASRVADYLEANDPGKWGIGRYPSSGFTHIDVRGHSARWTG